MSRRRNKQRMLPRAARRRARRELLEQAAAIERSPTMRALALAKVDHELVNLHIGGRDYLAENAPRVLLAEVWISCVEDPDGVPDGREALMAALAREYRRLTGRPLDDDEAQAAVDDYEERSRAAAWRRAHPHDPE
jgi:hypothetical protein